ncbi:MAG: hypothetical protein H5T49_04525 [Hadesarchaea archaeon]|nr:hypothetical protein [Hadesarchaea archaeon]
MPTSFTLTILLSASIEIQTTLLERFLWNMSKGLIYILVAVMLWLLLRKLNRIRPFKHKRSGR